MFNEGDCYLKTKSERLKLHWAVVMGNELYFYKDRTDDKHRIMHSLVGTFIKEMPEESDEEGKYKFYPIKVILPPCKSRVLYFPSQTEQQKWVSIFKEVIGYSNVFDYYEVDKTLGKGQFGVVKLARHKKTG